MKAWVIAALLLQGCATAERVERFTIADIRNGAAMTRSESWRECSTAIADALEREAEDAKKLEIKGVWSVITVAVDAYDRKNEGVDDVIEKKCAVSALRFMKAAIKLGLDFAPGGSALKALPLPLGR